MPMGGGGGYQSGTHKANNNCMMDCSVWGRGKEGGGEILLKIGFLLEIVS
jgi:hypothetical protein